MFWILGQRIWQASRPGDGHGGGTTRDRLIGHGQLYGFQLAFVVEFMQALTSDHQ